jgi:hypothetical protein
VPAGRLCHWAIGEPSRLPEALRAREHPNGRLPLQNSPSKVPSGGDPIIDPANMPTMMDARGPEQFRRGRPLSPCQFLSPIWGQSSTPVEAICPPGRGSAWKSRPGTPHQKRTRNNASRPRQKTLAGVGHENADADHAKECCNYLDHHNGPLHPAARKRHGRPNSQKNSVRRKCFAMQLMIFCNRECKNGGQLPARTPQ